VIVSDNVMYGNESNDNVMYGNESNDNDMNYEFVPFRSNFDAILYIVHKLAITAAFSVDITLLVSYLILVFSMHVLLWIMLVCACVCVYTCMCVYFYSVCVC